MYKKGFTLVEMLVATGIFTLIMVSLLGSLISTNQAARNAQAIRAAMDNLNFALEDMTRTVRLGYNYSCFGFVDPGRIPPDSECTSNQLYVLNNNNPTNTTKYILYTVQNTGAGRQLFRCEGNSEAEAFAQCVTTTAPELFIDELQFDLSGASDDTLQPRVFITTTGTATVRGEQSQFSIQTLVSQRQFETFDLP